MADENTASASTTGGTPPTATASGYSLFKIFLYTVINIHFFQIIYNNY
jgi:hypothetical protein